MRVAYRFSRQVDELNDVIDRAEAILAEYRKIRAATLEDLKVPDYQGLFVEGDRRIEQALAILREAIPVDEDGPWNRVITEQYGLSMCSSA